MSKVPTQPDHERRKSVIDSLPPGAPVPEMDADGNIVGTEDYGGTPLRPEIDANGNIVGTGGPVGKFPPSAGKSIAGLIKRLNNWRTNDLLPWLFGMARAAIRRPYQKDQKAQISWATKYVQSIIDIFPERRGRPQQYEDGADRARAFRKRKSEAKSAEQLMREIIKAYDQTRDSRGRSREIRSGGRSVMNLPEFNDSPVLGPDNDQVGPAVGGSFFANPLTKNGKGGVIGSRRRNTFDPDKPSREGGDLDEPNESESKFVRRQNWSINTKKLTKEGKHRLAMKCIEELADNNSFQAFWCPWPKEFDYALSFDPDNSGRQIPDEDETYGLCIEIHCSMQMPNEREGEPPKQCAFHTVAEHIDEEVGRAEHIDEEVWPIEQQHQILEHIEQDHQKEWRELLRAHLLNAPIITRCSSTDHERMRLKCIMEKERDKRYCGRCNRLIYDPARNHPDAAVRREYEGR